MSLETGAYQCDKALVTSYKGDDHGTQSPPPTPLSPQSPSTITVHVLEVISMPEHNNKFMMDFNRHQGYIEHEEFSKICNAHTDLPKSALCEGTAEVRI